MSYVEQVEQQVAQYPETASLHVPVRYGIAALPAYMHVMVHDWDADFCELRDANAEVIARFCLVG